MSGISKKVLVEQKYLLQYSDVCRSNWRRRVPLGDMEFFQERGELDSYNQLLNIQFVPRVLSKILLISTVWSALFPIKKSSWNALDTTIQNVETVE